MEGQVTFPLLLPPLLIMEGQVTFPLMLKHTLITEGQVTVKPYSLSLGQIWPLTLVIENITDNSQVYCNKLKRDENVQYSQFFCV